MNKRNEYLDGVNLYNAKIPLLCKSVYEDDTHKIIYYDGSNKWTDDGEYKRKIKYLNKREDKHIYVECIHCQNCKKNEKHETIDECYSDIIKNFDLLKIVSKNKINMYITGNIKHTIYKLFFELNSLDLHYKIKPVETYEIEWIENATQGALVYKNNDYKQVEEKTESSIICHKYDYNSFYPYSLMCKNSWPLSKGELKTIDKFECKFGIYRVKVNHSENYSGYLKPVKTNRIYYTHIDLIELQKLNIEFELIQDEKPNALIYDTDSRMKGDEIFKKYVELLYEIKTIYKECKYAKTLLNNLWGLFCQKKLIKFYYSGDNEFKCEDAVEMKALRDSNSDIIGWEYKNVKNYYSGLIPRIKPFLLSCNRKYIYKLSKEYYETNELMAVYTDSIIIKNKIKDFKNSTKIGELKYEGEQYFY